MQLNWLDCCLAGLVLFSTLIGFARGLVQEVSSVTRWVLSLWGGVVFSGPVSHFLPEAVQPPIVRCAIGFFAVFLTSLAGVSSLTSVTQWGMTSLGLKGPDKVLGVLVGGLRGVLCVVLVMVVFEPTLSQSSVWGTSQIVNYFMPLKGWFITLIPLDWSSVTDQ